MSATNGQNTDQADTGIAPFLPLLEIALGAPTFAANWSHCHRIATYIARMVSHNRANSAAYLNLFSSALNELLETAFRTHKGNGNINCTVSRAGKIDRIALTIPCDEHIQNFYSATITELGAQDATDRYMAALTNRDIDPRLGLMGLAADYKATISIRPDSKDNVCLIADLMFDEIH